MTYYKKLYQPNRTENERVVFLVPKEEIEKVDEWGVPAGMTSRAQAIRELIKKGLEAASNERAAS